MSVWSIWIDEEKRVISVKETLHGKELCFETVEDGMKTVADLVLIGYRIG